MDLPPSAAVLAVRWAILSANSWVAPPGPPSVLVWAVLQVAHSARKGSKTEAAIGGGLGSAGGSVIGHQLGGSTGSTIGAGVGGAVGGAVGNNLGNDGDRHHSNGNGKGKHKHKNKHR